MTEPYSLNPEGQRHGPDRPQDIGAVTVKYDEDVQGWTIPSFMGPMNIKIVRRSNALLGYPYGKDFRYEEAILTSSGPGGWLKATAGALCEGRLNSAERETLRFRFGCLNRLPIQEFLDAHRLSPTHSIEHEERTLPSRVELRPSRPKRR